MASSYSPESNNNCVYFFSDELANLTSQASVLNWGSSRHSCPLNGIFIFKIGYTSFFFVFSKSHKIILDRLFLIEQLCILNSKVTVR